MAARTEGARPRGAARPLSRVAVGGDAAADDREGGGALFRAFHRALADGRRSRRRRRARRDGRLGGARLLQPGAQPHRLRPNGRGAARSALSRQRGRRSPKLPGIGAYTAAAIAAIAFDRPAAAVDGNVERVVARLFAITSRAAGPEGGGARCADAARAERASGRIRRGADGSRRHHLHAEEARLFALPLVGAVRGAARRAVRPSCRRARRRRSARTATASPMWRAAPTARSCSAAGRRAGCSAA